MQNKKKLFLGMLIVLLTEVIFFRAYLFTDILIGDTVDALLNNLIVEHWYQVFRGTEHFANLNIFYPMTNTISYTDMLFGLALPYSFLRSMGLNLFLANKVMLIGVHAFGALTYFYLLFRRVKLSLPASVLGCVLVFSASSFYVKLIHTQFFVLGYVPLLMLFLSLYYDKAKLQSRQRYVYGCLSVLTLVFILYSSWYVGFFFCLFSLLAFLIFVATRIFSSDSQGLQLLFFKYAKELVMYIVVAGIALFPFLQAYLPTARMAGQWDWHNVTLMLPSLYDFVNVSERNLFYGGIFGNFFFTGRELHWELTLGFPFVTLVLFLLASYCYLHQPRQNRLLTVICLTTLVSFLLLVKIHDFSLWYGVFKLIPGAAAIRAASRYMFFLSFAVSFVLANFYDYVMLNIAARKHKMLSLGLCIFIPCFLLLENMHTTAQVYGDNAWTIVRQESIINRIVAPNNKLPFYIANSEPEKHREKNEEYQLHSWLAANKYNLKTVNGYSGKFPPDWELLRVADKEYQDRVDEWMLRNNISTLQRYDIAKNCWENHNVGRLSKPLFLQGWYWQEPWGRWAAAPKASIVLPAAENGRAMELSFTAHTFYIGHKIAVSCGETLLGEINVTTEDKPYKLLIPADSVKQQNNIKIIFTDSTTMVSPKDVGVSLDYRKLGIGISDIKVKPSR